MSKLQAPSAISTTPLSNRTERAWRAAFPALLAVLAAIVALYWGTAEAMVTIWWRSETFNHAFVVLPIVLWLVWRRKQELGQLAPRPSAVVLLPMAGLALLWMLGHLAAVNSVTQLAFVAMLVLAVPAILGVPVARVIAFPLAFTFFAVPIGEFVMPQMISWTADFTIMALRASGIPVFREGTQFVIPSGNWSVVEACSGVRYLIASFCVGTLFAYLNYRSTGRRVLFILVSILVPIIANWARAYMIVMIGHLSGNRLAVGVDHIIYGWVFFGIVILLMFFIGAKWSEPEAAIPAPTALVGSSGATGSIARSWVVAVVALMLVALPIFAVRTMEAAVSTKLPALAALGSLADGWQRADPASIGFKPHFENPSVQSNDEYSSVGQAVGVYVGYYRDQDYRRKLVGSSNVLVMSTDHDWSQVDRSSLHTRFGDKDATVSRAEIRRLGNAGPGQPERLIAWQVYWINGTLTSNDYLAKIYSALYQLLGRGDESAVIVVYAGTSRDGTGGDALLTSFMRANYSAIDAMLQKTKATR